MAQSSIKSFFGEKENEIGDKDVRNTEAESTLTSQQSLPSVPCDLGSKDGTPVQPMLKKFPPNKFDNRGFTSHWYDSYTWLEYSVACDSVFCFTCRHFSKAADDSQLKFGYNKWKNLSTVLPKHNKSKSHHASCISWQSYKESIQSGSVTAKVITGHDKIVEENRAYLARITDAVRYLAKQGLAFRGHDETAESNNRGNFLELLHIFAKIDPVFDAKSKNVSVRKKYTSPDSQNELIDCFSEAVIAIILKDIKNSASVCLGSVPYFTIIADESRDSSRKEQLSLVIRYVSADWKICEEFIGFYHLNQLDAKSISETIQVSLKAHGLNNFFLVAQCYDGANVMSGNRSGVQARLREIYPEAAYLHCYAHRLNLVLVASCKQVKALDDFFSILEKLYVFVSRSSPIHEKFKNLQTNFKQRELKHLCDTRWACRYEAVVSVSELFETIIQLLTELQADREYGVEAVGLLHKILSVSFVSALEIAKEVFGICETLSNSLQKVELNVGDALNLVKCSKSILIRKRESGWADIWKEILKFCEKNEISVEVTTLEGRFCRKRKRKEIPGEVIYETCGQSQSDFSNVEDQMKIGIFYPCLDNFSSELNCRFSDENLEIMQAAGSLLCMKSSSFLQCSSILPLVKKYNRCLNVNEQLLKHEIEIAQEAVHHFQCTNLSDLLKNIEGCRNLLKCMCLALTLPVSSASCERSFSSMKHIKTYRRSTMGDSRLSALSIAFCNAERVNTIETNDVVELFVNRKCRKENFA